MDYKALWIRKCKTYFEKYSGLTFFKKFPNCIQTLLKWVLKKKKIFNGSSYNLLFVQHVIVNLPLETETRFFLDSHGRGGQVAQNVHGFI